MKRLHQLMFVFVLAVLPGRMTAQLPSFLPFGNHLQAQARWAPGAGQVTIILRFVGQNDGNLNTYASRKTAYFGSYQDYKNYVLMKSSKLLLLAKTKASNAKSCLYCVKAVINGKEYDFNVELPDLRNAQPQNFVPGIPDFDRVVIKNFDRFAVMEDGVEHNLLTNGAAILGETSLHGLNRARYAATLNGQTGTYTQTGDLLAPPVLSISPNPLSLTIQMTAGSDTTIEISTDLVSWEPFDFFGWWYSASGPVSMDFPNPWWYYGDWSWRHDDWIWQPNFVWEPNPDDPGGDDGQWLDEGQWFEVYQPPPPVPSMYYSRAKSE